MLVVCPFGALRMLEVRLDWPKLKLCPMERTLQHDWIDIVVDVNLLLQPESIEVSDLTGRVMHANNC